MFELLKLLIIFCVVERYLPFRELLKFCLHGKFLGNAGNQFKDYF